jgi:hypothetical protein
MHSRGPLATADTICLPRANSEPYRLRHLYTCFHILPKTVLPALSTHLLCMSSLRRHATSWSDPELQEEKNNESSTIINAMVMSPAHNHRFHCSIGVRLTVQCFDFHHEGWIKVQRFLGVVTVSCRRCARSRRWRWVKTVRLAGRVCHAAMSAYATDRSAK